VRFQGAGFGANETALSGFGSKETERLGRALAEMRARGLDCDDALIDEASELYEQLRG